MVFGGGCRWMYDRFIRIIKGYRIEFGMTGLFDFQGF